MEKQTVLVFLACQDVQWYVYFEKRKFLKKLDSSTVVGVTFKRKFRSWSLTKSEPVLF